MDTYSRSTEVIDNLLEQARFAWYHNPTLTLGQLVQLATDRAYERAEQSRPVTEVPDEAMAWGMGLVTGDAIRREAETSDEGMPS